MIKIKNIEELENYLQEAYKDIFVAEVKNKKTLCFRNGEKVEVRIKSA